MTKKNMQSIVTALTPMAGTLPTQRPQPVQAVPKLAPASANEPLVQFSFSLRKSQRKQLARLASDEDVPMRAFILEALREKGLDVTEDDLRDLRKEKG